MTRKLSRLAPPNDDLAVDRNRRVYKLRAKGWLRLEYHMPSDALMLAGRAPYRAEYVES